MTDTRRNEALRAEVRRLRAAGLSVRAIAERVERSPTRIWTLLHEDDHHRKEKS